MSKNYISLGLMSGTSGDGVDASIIRSDGQSDYEVISDKYFEYSSDIFIEFHKLRDKINNSQDLKKFSKNIVNLEREITIFHAGVVDQMVKNIDIDIIGFHGQTIYHNAQEKISKQLGNGELLSQLVKKDVIYNFRKNDLMNGGQGAPLAPIFHKLLSNKLKLNSAIFINIGGIVNETVISKNNNLSATDLGPGMCLIDQWIRSKTKKKFDINGQIAKAGKINEIILEQALENFSDVNKIIYNKKKQIQSFDIKDFDLSFVRGLSLEDGAATLIEYSVKSMLPSLSQAKENKIILCGGGRKNKFLLERLKANKIELKLIDDYGINGDFIESQAFAYLAIRSNLKIPISFPETTGCIKPSLGGDFIKI